MANRASGISGSAGAAHSPTAGKAAESTKQPSATERSSGVLGTQESARPTIREPLGALWRGRINKDITSDIASPISKEKASPPAATTSAGSQDKPTRTTENHQTGEPAKTTGLFGHSGRISRKAEPSQAGHASVVPVEQGPSGGPASHTSGGQTPRDNGDGRSGEYQNRGPKNHPTIIDNIHGRDEVGVYRSARYGSEHVLYHDRPYLAEPRYHYVHMYQDWRDRICHRIIWPRFHFTVGYNWGPSWTLRYVYPYYLRKYVFVSLGGYWPIEYGYTRYYWYGCHPYYWCGYYPVAQEVQGDTYNYYTYNYNYEDDGTDICPPAQTAQGVRLADNSIFEDVPVRLAQPAIGGAEPGQPTVADNYFEEAVKAFEAGNYSTAVEKLACAMEYAPEDMVLPFAYAQALLANEQYTEAADVLRSALEKVSPEKEGVFFARGLYPDDDVLSQQIDRLAEKAELYSYDADLQLLWGYQLLGIGEVDQALESLSRATQDLQNATAAKVLLDLAEKIKAGSTPQ